MPLLSPLLDDYAQTGMVTPPLKRAFDLAQNQMAPSLTGMSAMPGATPQPDQNAAPSSVAPPMGTKAATAPAPQASASAASTVAAPMNPSIAAHQQELNRVTAPPRAGTDPLAHTKQDTGQSGIDQIHNPWVRTPLKILDAIGSTFLPALTMGLPGTQLHHQLVARQAAGSVARDQSQLNDEQKRGLEGAQQANQESMPEAREATAENKRLSDEAKNTTANEKIKADSVSKRAQIDAVHRRFGEQFNEDTQSYEPIPLEKLSVAEQGLHDLQQARAQLAQSGADLKDAQASNDPARLKLAQQKYDLSQRTHDDVERRLKLSENQFEMRSRGTQGGAALPGAILGDDNKPVGTAFQQNVRPTGTERNKGDMANSAHEQLGTLKDIVSKRPDIFGPAAGRKTNFDVWLGSQDPDAQRFIAARTIAGDHLAGTFGGRSEAALKALDDAIGQFKTNPQAVSAGLDQLDKANDVFRKAGTPKTAGSNAAANAGGSSVPTVNSKQDYDKLPSGATYMEDGKKYRKP